MNRTYAAVAVVAATALVGCQSSDELKQKNETLEKRVAELEQKLEASPAAAPVAVAPYAEPAMAPAPVEPMAAAPAEPAAPRPATHTRSTRSSSSRTASHSTPTQTASHSGSSAGSNNPMTPTTPIPSDRVQTVDVPVAGDPGPSRAAEDLEKFAPRVVPEGTEMQLVLETALSSDGSREGERVTARVARAVGSDGRVVLPGGSVLNGHVTDADQAGRVSGRSRISVAFDELVVRGKRYPVKTTDIQVDGPESHKHDAAVIAGSTVGGAILGGILDGGHGAKRGAVIGAAGGTGAVLVTRGKEVTIPSGTRWTVKTKDSVQLY